MKIKQILNQSVANGVSLNTEAVPLIGLGGGVGNIGSVTVQFERGVGATGEMTLQGRLTSDASWVNLTTDSGGLMQVVATCSEYRVAVVVVGVTAVKQCWIGA
jgi:hypothetical protein